MKLRNKKTGEIIDGGDYLNVYDDLEHQGKAWHYNSLAELNEDWEDVEPLIKDEKVRKIIRAWADENDSTRAVYYSPKNELTDSYGNIISFNLIFSELHHGAEYTIDELCGEEEE